MRKTWIQYILFQLIPSSILSSSYLNTLEKRGFGNNSPFQDQAICSEHEDWVYLDFANGMGHYIYFSNCEGDVTSNGSEHEIRTVNRISRKPIITERAEHSIRGFATVTRVS